MNRLRSVIAGFALVTMAVGATTSSGPAGAQSNPAGEDKQLKALVKELKNELKRGEPERLIDPWYLHDLRKILGRYEIPWSKRLFSDNFSGRGPQPDPPWQVTAGKILIDWRYGLCMVVEPPVQQQTQSSDKDRMKQLFGQLLQQALTDELGGQTAQQPSSPSDRGFAAAIAPVKITNAFALRVELTSRVVKGSRSRASSSGPIRAPTPRPDIAWPTRPAQPAERRRSSSYACSRAAGSRPSNSTTSRSRSKTATLTSSGGPAPAEAAWW